MKASITEDATGAAAEPRIMQRKNKVSGNHQPFGMMAYMVFLQHVQPKEQMHCPIDPPAIGFPSRTIAGTIINARQQTVFYSSAPQTQWTWRGAASCWPAAFLPQREAGSVAAMQKRTQQPCHASIHGVTINHGFNQN